MIRSTRGPGPSLLAVIPVCVVLLVVAGARKFASDIALNFREQAKVLRAEAELQESQRSPGALRTARAFLWAREAMKP